MFAEGPSPTVFVSKEEGLKFCLKLLALPTLVSVSCLAKAANSEHVKRWFLCFSLVEMQQLYLNAFFIFASFFSSWLQGRSSVVAFGAFGSFALFAMPLVTSKKFDFSGLKFSNGY